MWCKAVGNRSSLLQKKDVFRYRVEIAGIDVTSDLVGYTERLGDAGSGHYQ